MKTTHRCPKCNHDHILYIATVSDRYGDTTSSSNASVPMKIAHIEKPFQLLGLAASTTERAGELEAGVCKRCGYTEMHTKEPGSIPVDGTLHRQQGARR